jgi:hypothetical protein
LLVASTILMIRPAAFGFNAETATNNFFQSKVLLSEKEVQQKVLAEFDNMVDLLRKNDIDVVVIEDTAIPPKPDAIFPNNWFSTTPSGTLIVYPLFSPNRRTEKRDDIINYLSDHFVVNAIQDWSEYEVEGRFLEGTGSMIMDHDNKMIYASISARTNLSLLEKFAETNGYQAMVFLATDINGQPVYHTNVMMGLGSSCCILCEEAIDEEWELIALRQLLDSTHRAIIPINRIQMAEFAGNMLEVKNTNGESILIMSLSAYSSLRKEQKEMLEAYAQLLPVAIPVIEQVGGGSVRCMMAEIFLQRK